MSISLGETGSYSQTIAQFEDEADLFAMGHCKAQISVSINGNTVTYFTTETSEAGILASTSKIVLTTPQNNNLIGP